jgi:hypothetical protein
MNFELEMDRLTSFAMTGNIKSLCEVRRTDAIPDIINVSAHKNLVYFPPIIQKMFKNQEKNCLINQYLQKTLIFQGFSTFEVNN